MDMAMNQSEGEDRLSALPNDIIREILSLLPFESVIVISTLSHQWQRLSTDLSSLTFSPSFLAGSHKVSGFWTSFLTFSSNLTSPLSRSLILHLPPLFFIDCPLSFSDSWFRQICGSSVHTIQLSSYFCGGEYDFVAPSNRVFQMESLRVLELGGCFAWSLPSDPTTIRLPNLKKLSIHVVCHQFKLLGSLITSLPSLEDLSFRVNCDLSQHSHNDDHVDDHVSFSCPNLKRLSARVYFKRAVFVIDAPVLEYLKVVSYYKSRFYFVQKSALLVEAALKVRNWSCTCCDGTLFDVLEAVSNARSLAVGSTVKPYTGELLTYPNLTTLVYKLSPWANLKLLDIILKNCPVLQEVKLEAKDLVDDFTEEGWSFSNFMLTHVKIIRLKLRIYHRRLNFIKQLLSKACVLEQLHINININIIFGKHCTWMRRLMALELFKELVEYQEKLLRCHIEFSGFGVKFSCNGSKLIEELRNSTELSSSDSESSLEEELQYD